MILFHYTRILLLLRTVCVLLISIDSTARLVTINVVHQIKNIWYFCRQHHPARTTVLVVVDGTVGTSIYRGVISRTHPVELSYQQQLFIDTADNDNTAKGRG